MTSKRIRVLQRTVRKVVTRAVGAPTATTGAFRQAMEEAVIAVTRVAAEKALMTP